MVLCKMQNKGLGNYRFQAYRFQGPWDHGSYVDLRAGFRPKAFKDYGIMGPEVTLLRDLSGIRAARLRTLATLLLLGGSWVVISRVISRLTILITHTRGLITLLITTPEPPSRDSHVQATKALKP